jgi:pimeloyl-ACP methyl ester carboxylesterase
MPVASANSIKLFYDEVGDPSAPVILLIMGLGVQMIEWPETFCEGLAKRGFRVVRFDNRDIGLSTKFESAAPVDVPATFARVMSGQPIEVPYLLNDMARDTIGLLDAISVQRAHLVGLSMGGMIAQIIAAEHTERVRSLVSIMSSSGDPNLPPGKPAAMALLTAPLPSPQDREARIEFGVKVWQTIGSPGFPTPEAKLRAKVMRAVERSSYDKGFSRQLVAILADGSRVNRLKRIVAPTLVIHGADDPLIPVECGEDTARNIPGAKLMIEPGMGHDLPEALIPTLVEAIAAHCQAADAALVQ